LQQILDFLPFVTERYVADKYSKSACIIPRKMRIAASFKIFQTHFAYNKLNTLNVYSYSFTDLSMSPDILYWSFRYTADFILRNTVWCHAIVSFLQWAQSISRKLKRQIHIKKISKLPSINCLINLYHRSQ